MVKIGERLWYFVTFAWGKQKAKTTNIFFLKKTLARKN